MTSIAERLAGDEAKLSGRSVCVFCPLPMLTVTIEPHGDDDAGQGDGQEGEAPAPREAVAAIRAFGNSEGITGFAEFTQSGSDVSVVTR